MNKNSGTKYLFEQLPYILFKKLYCNKGQCKDIETQQENHQLVFEL